MKKKNALIHSLVLIVLFMVSCNDDDIPNCIQDLTGELSANETAFAHKWVLAEIVSVDEIDITDDNTDNPSTNLFEQYSACERDASYSFDNDRDYTFQQGEMAPNCDNKQSSTGTWKLTGNRLTLVSFCNLREIELEINDDDTSFFIEDVFDFTDVNSKVVRTKVKFTYNKTL